MKRKNQILINLFNIGAIKFGQFKLKSGIISPVYIDLRILISYPSILKTVARLYCRLLEKLKFDRMVAVPYTGIPLVCAISLINNKPWIYTRKEVKNYGTKKAFEGDYKKGEIAVLVDDMITTGASKIETVSPLLKAGLKVKDIVVLFDREQGGAQFLKQKGFRLHSLFTLKEWLVFLRERNKISESDYQKSIEFLNKR